MTLGLIWIEEVLFGWGLPLLLLGVGLVYFIFLRAFPYLHPLRTARLAMNGDARSSLRALSLALGGTLGVGNITGVALALAAGGAGALFWMWVSAAVAMFLKYGEIVLAFLTRRRGADGSYEGGAMLYLLRWGKGGRIIAALFSVLCLFCALTLGAPVQSNTAALACREILGVPPAVTGTLLLGLTALAVFGGVRRIASFTERIIPFMSVLYLALSLYAVLSHIESLIPVLGRVVSDAFSFSSGVAGAGGFLVSRAVRYGVTRGLLSNEAGAGTAPMAHAVAENTAVSQGIMGLLEVAIDTFVFCTATAIPLLIAFPDGFPERSGVGLVTAAFRILVGDFSAPILCISLVLFAYATVLAWCYYGRRALAHLVGYPFVTRGYLFVYVFLVGAGALLGERVLWRVTDGIVSSLTMLHTACLLPLLPLVVEESRRGGVFGKLPCSREGKTEGAKRIREIGNGGRKKGHGMTVRRVGKGEGCRVEHGARKAVTLAPIQAIPAKRQSDRR